MIDRLLKTCKNRQIHILFYVLLFSLFTINTADSTKQTDTDQTEELVEQVDQFNQPKPNKECQHCLNYSSEPETALTSEQESELFQKCAVDLCGPANKSPRYIFDNSTFDTVDIDPEIVNNFNETALPAIEEAIQAKLNSDKRILTSVGEGLKNPDSISHEDWKYIAQIAYSTISPMKDLRHAYSTGNLSYITEKYEELVREYENNKTKFTEEEREEMIQLDQRLKNGDLDIGLIVTLDNLIKKSKTANCFEEPNCKQWMYSELSKLHQEYARTLQDQENDTQKHINYCQSVYISELRSPQAFIDNLEDYKNKFLNRAFSNYSSLSKQSFGNYMNETLEFKLPSSQANNIIHQNFIDEVREAKSLFQRRSNRMDNLHYALSQIIGKPKHPLPICTGPLRKQFKKTSILLRKNRISLSLLSCTFHEHGKHDLAHEIGHALSYLFNSNKLSEKSYGKYKELRECASKRYKKGAPHTLSKPSKNHRLYHNNDKLKTEEDTADLIAYKVFQDDSGPLFCSSLTPSKNGERYESLTMFQPGKHSATLLRTIMEAIHKRIELPPSCQQVVDIYSDRINFEPCF